MPLRVLQGEQIFHQGLLSMAEDREEMFVTLLVTQVLDALSIPYLVAGGMASIIHGEIRTTLDVDLLADLKMNHVEALASALDKDFFVDIESIREAIISRRSFNIIHRDMMFKVDMFIPKLRSFDRDQFEHRTLETVGEDPQRQIWVASPEDTVLSKLEWYKMGGGVSEKQWRDILGVLKTQTDKLDVAYMRRVAAALSVSDLLEIALEGSNPPEGPANQGQQARLF